MMTYKPVRDRAISRVESEVTPNVVAASMRLKQWRVIGRKGDLVAILTGIYNPDRKKDEPALVLANHRSPCDRHVFIPLSHLWRMVEPDAMRTAVPSLCLHLYGFVTRDDLFRVTDAIYEFAEDLQKAPPPEWLATRDWLEALAQDGFTMRINDESVNA